MAERVVRTAVVTGAASGFGLAVAGELAGRGADVALLDIDADRLGAAAAAVAAEARPEALGSGEVAEEDLMAMMDSRPMTDVDLTTAEVAAAAAVDDVLAGEPHVITHGDLVAAVAERNDAIDRALARVAARRGDP